MEFKGREQVVLNLRKQLELSADLWNTFCDLQKDRQHPSDSLELNRDIHNIQNRIFSLAMLNGITYAELEPSPKP